MKKSLLFAAAALVGLSASAVQPCLPVDAMEVSKYEATPVVASKAIRNDVSLKDVTEPTKAVIKLPSTLFYFGLSDDYMGIGTNVGLTSPYERLTFKSESTGVSKLSWTYPNVWGAGDAEELTSSENSITYSAPFGYFHGPSLTVFGPDYIDAIDLEIDTQYPSAILYGANSSALRSDRMVLGMTPISRMQVYPPFEEDAKFTSGHILGFNHEKDSPVDEMWGGYVADLMMEKDSNLTTVDSIAIATSAVYSGFGTIFPKPASPYLVQNVWAWCRAKFNGAGTLLLKVCLMEEDDKLGEVIAQGTCDYTAETSSGMFVFSLKSIDEDGFEIDEPVVINDRIAYVITDTEGGKNIEYLQPCWPMGYYYEVTDKNGERAKNPYLDQAYNLNIIKYTFNGEEVEDALYSPWGYYGDEAGEYLMSITSYAFFTDAFFGFCIEAGSEVAGDVHKGISDAGEEFVFTFESLYAVDEEEVEISDDSWITYELGEFDNQTGLQTLTILADPLEDGKEGNGSIITINAFAARPLHLVLGQGTLAVDNVNANSEVVASKYFDLQGRELKAQPDSGVVIRKDIKADGSSTVVKTVL